ncbi:MAG: hypothetical protein AAFQ22_02975 [Pseudomonadota bacterium]
MAIKLRVVGIFFSKADIEITKSPMSVKDVLDQAVSSPPPNTAFSYGAISKQGRESPSVFSAKYKSRRESQSSKRGYPAGEYVLAEDLISRPAYSVWQFYLFEPGLDGGLGAPINPASRQIVVDPNATPGSRFAEYGNTEVKDNETVIWRLINVLAEKTELPPSIPAPTS